MRHDTTFASRVLAIGVVGATLLFGPIGCRSEVKDKTPAEVGAPVETAQTATTSPTATATGNVIKEQSSVRFVGSKVTGDEHGEFKEFDGRIEYTGSQPSAVHFEIAPGSVSTGKEDLDKHLRSADFFESDTHPTAMFHGSSIQPATGATDGSTHNVTGDLTLKGITRSVTFPAKAAVSPAGVNVTAEFTIKRQDWNVSFKGAPDNLIRDEVLIKLDMKFPPPPAG